MKYFLGIDNGGTIIKAALYSAEGKELAVCSKKTKLIIEKPGYTERDMDELWRMNCSAIKELLSMVDIDPAEIIGISCCGHGKGLYLWGKDDKPVRNGIISTDNRAWQYPIKWKESGVADKVFKLTYQHILSCQPVSLLAWLNDREPECLAKTKWIFECKDYVRFMLTGEAFAEITDYSGTNLINLSTKQYDDEILKLFGLEFAKEMLPPLVGSTDICGYITDEVARLTGLAAGTPVAGGMFDIDACAIAVDAAHEDRMCMIAGTWSINEYIRKEAVLDGSVMMNSLFCIPGYYLIEECSPTSASNNEWFINTLLPRTKEEAEKNKQSVYEYVNTLVESVPASEFCPVFLPFLMASNVHPNAKACFVGISSYHTRAHLLRGVYEGITFGHRYHLEKLLSTCNKPIKEIRLAGGAVNSRQWVQIFADVMQYPIVTVDVGETGTLGCAMAAAVAVGEYKTFHEAASVMTRVKQEIQPNPSNVQIYNEKYAMYKQIITALDPVWNDLSELMGK